MQFAEAFAVLGGEGDRVAEPKGERLVGAGHTGPALGLVGDEDDRASRPAGQFGEGLVGRQNTGAGVDHEQHHVGGEDRRFGLHPHPAGQGVVVGLFQAGGVDDPEDQAAEGDIALAPVTGHAGAVVHKGELLAHEAVEQRRLADIRPADDRDGRHVHRQCLSPSVSG